MLKSAPKTSANHRPYVVLGLSTALMVFGGLGAWGAMARLDSAIIAPGFVNIETNRKTVQHLEGGQVDNIHVREGQIVKAGDVLVTLRPIQAEAQLETHQNALDAAMALEARLTAERNTEPTLTFPDDLKSRGSRPMTRKLMDDQLNQFRERRGLLEAQISLLNNRIEQLKKQIKGLKSVETASTGQLASLKVEHGKIKPLADKGSFPINRFLELERRVQDTEGRLGQTTADIAKNEEAIGETQLQILHAQQKFREEVVQALREARLQVGEAAEKIRVSRDILLRQEIRAPLSGMVHNLKLHTVGAVVRPGDPILELVPLAETLLIHARVAPTDINTVETGLDAEVRFPGVKARTTPVVMGKVRSVSRDVLRDENQRDMTYYLAVIEVHDKELPPTLRGKLTAGMPSDVIITTGERTPLQYLINPLFDGIRKTMREQ